MAISEYDAFGPWIYKIDEEHDIPRLFSPYVDRSDGALFRFKIPRNIERRKANPKMDLYDMLVNVYDDRIQIMRRDGAEVRDESVFFHQISAIIVFTELLYGNLKLYTDTSPVSIKYNTISTKVILELVSHIRSRYLPDRNAPVNGILDSEAFPETLEEPLFINLWNDLSRAGETFLSASYQHTERLPVPEADLLTRIRHHFRKPILQGALHLANKNELLVLNSNDSLGYYYAYVPLLQITSVKTGNATMYPGIREIQINTETDTFAFQYTENNRNLEAHYAFVTEKLLP